MRSWRDRDEVDPQLLRTAIAAGASLRMRMDEWGRRVKVLGDSCTALSFFHVMWWCRSWGGQGPWAVTPVSVTAPQPF
jgi:hypothetical protein